MILDLISTALGFIVPPVFDFIKKNFLKSKQDTEAINKIVLINANLLKTKIDFFNRDANRDVI